MKPIVHDLFCGLGGWAEGFLAEDYDVVGYDIEAHDYGTGGYPAILKLRDVRSIHGSELKDATCIVASPPCQGYSYRAMPWKRAKALPPPDNELFNACFRIQREAIEAAGHYVPLIVENVCGAQKWVGRARWHFGSYYLWGDVPALMPMTARSIMKPQPQQRRHGTGSWFAIDMCSSRRGVTDPKQIEGRKVPGIKLSEVGFNVAAAQRYREGQKMPEGHDTCQHFTNPGEPSGSKGMRMGRAADGSLQFGGPNDPRHFSSKSDSRKAASAMIAKIPFPLAQYIARCFKPRQPQIVSA